MTFGLAQISGTMTDRIKAKSRDLWDLLISPVSGPILLETSLNRSDAAPKHRLLRNILTEASPSPSSMPGLAYIGGYKSRVSGGARG